MNADGTSRILSIWDQTIYEPGDADEDTSSWTAGLQKRGELGRTPEGFDFGTEYTKEEISAAINSDNPWEIVPSRDMEGHGTFLAGVACGNQIEEEEFSGVAPLSSICVVKCKEAKQNLKDYYRIFTEKPCYAESDIMLGIRYLWNQAVQRQMSIVICIGMGTNQGGHNRGGVLGEMLQYYGDYRGTFVVTSVGNEANASHHFRSEMVMPNESTEVELRVGAGEAGFTMELWGNAPELYSVGLISPSGEYSGRTTPRLGERDTIQFLLEQTTVDIEYLVVSYESGDECIRIRFLNPGEGIWRIRVFNENALPGMFHIWLPIRNFISDSTYFLQANPDTTICDPANNVGLISIAYYQSANNSIVSESGRGFARDGQIRPDIASPGIEVFGPLPAIGDLAGLTPEERSRRARYGYLSGSSMACAVTAGAVALLVEWGFVRRNDISMDTVTVQKYLIRGADRNGMTAPNRTWGSGTLDLFGVFDALRPK